MWRGRRGWLLTLTLTLTRVRSRGFSRRSHSELSRRSREAAKSGLGRSGAHRTRSRAAERSSDALPCRSVALRRLGASNAGPRHWRLSSAAAEASTAVLVSALGFFEPFLGLTLDWAGSTLALRCLRTSVPSSITPRRRGVSSCRGRALHISLLSNRPGERGPSDSCQPGRPFRQVRFASHQPAKHWLGPHGCSWAVPRRCKACATPARHTGVCSRLCTASAYQNIVHGTCGSLGITNIGAQGRGEQ